MGSWPFSTVKPFLFLGLFAAGSALSAPKPSPIATSMDPAAFRFLKDLVEIPSGTSSIGAQQRMRDRIRQEFMALGLDATEIEGASGRKVLVLQMQGAKPHILLVGHTDTVPNPTGNRPKLTVDDLTLKGSGVIDMKGGIVVMHKVLKDLATQGRTDILKSVRIVLNDDEETGSVGSREILQKQAEGCDAALILEPGLPDGALVTGHSGIRWIKITVHGKAAHAGLEPEKGLNACVELGHKLVSLGSLSDIANHLTVTPGVIEGGTAPNTICETASVKLDIRYRNRSDLEEVLKKIRTISDRSYTANDLLGFKTSAEIEELVAIPPMPEDVSKSLFNIARMSGATLRQNVTGQSVGYVSDGNQLASLGIPILVGLGPYGGGMHSSAEFMDVRSFSERALLVKALLEQLSLEKKSQK